LSEPACAFKAGISPHTLREWFRKGVEDPFDKHHDFAMAMGLALADFEEASLKDGAKFAAEGLKTWTWYMTHLERRFPEHYGQRRKLDVQHEAVGALETRLHELNAGERTTGD
jgi:hypothetical protein